MKIQNLTTVCAAVACALTFSANAANLNANVGMKNAAQIAGVYSSDNINDMLNLTGDVKMTAKTVGKLPMGGEKVRFQQEYKGIKVFGHSIAATR